MSTLFIIGNDIVAFLRDNAEWIAALVAIFVPIIDGIYKLCHKKDETKNNQRINNVNNSIANQAGRDIDHVEQRK